MVIPTSLYESFPECSGNFDEIQAHLLALEENKLHTVHPKTENGILPKTVFKLFIYNQIVLHRVVELSINIIHAWEIKAPPTAFILLRTLNENISVIIDADLRLTKLIEAKNFKGIYKLIFNLHNGTRLRANISQIVEDEIRRVPCSEENMEAERKDVEEAYTAQNILNVMDRLSKVFPGYRGIYEEMSEYSHPNYSALQGMYGYWEDSTSIKISSENSFTLPNALKFFKSFAMFLILFVDAYDSILRKFGSIAELSKGSI